MLARLVAAILVVVVATALQGTGGEKKDVWRVWKRTCLISLELRDETECRVKLDDRKGMIVCTPIGLIKKVDCEMLEVNARGQK